jgi:hypothetical protein
VPVATLSKALAAGLVHRHPDGGVDEASADAWNAARPARAAAAARRSGRPGAPRRGSVAAAQKRLLDVRRKLAALELRRRSGELVDAEQVRRETFAYGRRIRDRLLGVEARLAPVVAGHGGDIPACAAAIRAEMRLCCEELSTGEGAT